MSSRQEDPDIAKKPFKDRIRPGMVVSWTGRADGGQNAAPASNLAYILCPVAAVGPYAVDVGGELIKSKEDQADKSQLASAYLCASIKPGFLHESYDVQLWRHVVVSLDKMDAEVLLEYDSGTRYYFVTV